MALRRVAALDDLRPGEMKGVSVDGQKVVVLNVGGTVCAYADYCAHKGVPLSTGRLIDDVLLCDVHYWEYDSKTGCGINPAGVQLRKFRVAVREDGIWVDPFDEEEVAGDCGKRG
jgi:toluene monooxygenase system ferredoxin subunit